jgi:hypothetical protein
MKTYSNSREKGNSLIEFALVLPFLVLALLGVVGVGMTLSRGIQVTQVTRDTGHMFFDGVDFSLAGNQQIVGRLAYGMGLASNAQGVIDTSGNGIVILSQIIKVGPIECLNAGYASILLCPNYNQLAIEKRIVIGNSGLRSSTFGTPSSALVQSDGTISPHDYCTDPSVLVSSTSTVSSLNLTADHYTYAVESYFVVPSLGGFLADSAYAFVMM